MNIALWLERQAINHPQSPAILEGDEVIASYADWYRRVQSIAGHWRSMGLAPGDRIAIYLKNQPAYLLAMWAAWQIGAIVVPVNRKLHPKELGWIVGNSGAALLCTDDTDAVVPVTACRRVSPHELSRLASTPVVSVSGLAAPPVERAATDTAWLFYTSGTTGKPKGVELTHRNLHCMALAYFSDVDRIEPEDASLYAAPLSHGAGMYMIPHVLAGAKHVLPRSGGFDEGEILGLADRVGRLSFFAAPTMVNRLVQTAQAMGHRGEGIKTVVYGGGPMYVEDIRRAVALLGDRFVQIYGQGECPMTITALGRAAIREAVATGDVAALASVGVAQSVVEVRVVDDVGVPVAVGEVGEVVARGDITMKGYWADEAATRAALRDGWLWTGDMGALDAGGRLTLKDRSKDVIITGGSNVYPREVEEVLLLHPDVVAAAVIGAPDAEWGERVVAFVQCVAGRQLDAEMLDAHCLEHLARFKRPKQYERVEAMPVNAYGKVLKTELRHRLLNPPV